MLQVGSQAAEQLSRTLELWWRQERYAEALSATGLSHALSAAAARELMQRLEPLALPWEQAPLVAGALLPLAERRFNNFQRGR